MNLGNIYFLETYLCKYNLGAVVIRSHGIGALRPVEGVILRVEDFLQHGRPAVKSHPFEGRKGLRARQQNYNVRHPPSLIFCHEIFTCSTSRWADTAATVQPNW